MSICLLQHLKESLHFEWTQRMQLTHSSSDEGRRVSDVLEALTLDEIRHAIREVLIVSFHIVLQYQPTQGACWFILGKVGKGQKNIYG